MTIRVIYSSRGKGNSVSVKQKEKKNSVSIKQKEKKN